MGLLNEEVIVIMGRRYANIHGTNASTYILYHC
jgi:hypothetical protein